MIQIDPRDAAPPQPAQVPACWGWRRCQRRDGADKCALKLEACLSGRRPRFGDFHEPRPLTKEERTMPDVPGCANFRRRA